MSTDACRPTVLLLLMVLCACDPTVCVRHSDCPIDEICTVGLCAIPPPDAGDRAGDASAEDSMGPEDSASAAPVDSGTSTVVVPDAGTDADVGADANADAAPATDGGMSAAPPQEESAWSQPRN